MSRALVSLMALLIVGVTCRVDAQTALLQPLAGSGATPEAPWRVVGLPKQTKPFTQFSLVDLDGRRVLRIEADKSYGNLVHPLHAERAAASHLAWQWRVEHLIAAADLHDKSGDDTSLKVCVSFDESLDHVPFAERQLLRFARSRIEEPVPTATVCYVWDTTLPAGTVLDNAFTRRMRYMVLQSGASKLDKWVSERRDVAADFLQLFGAESPEVPAITAVAVGADADNTQSRSVGYISGLTLTP